ncbi:MAG: sugar phosphate isomerase/epimerase [Firmicutes bacterium]|nr:sugar phosphate isomerase/epimerase [Bacillota bacterium]
MAMKIGAMLESFLSDPALRVPQDHQGAKRSLDSPLKMTVPMAASVGAKGIQAYASFGELAPENMTPALVKEWLDLVKSHGMVFSAICGDLGGHGFENEEDNKDRVERSKRIMDLAKMLECDVVTTHIGVVPTEENAKKEVMRKACRELALYADSIGSAFAVETGPETAQVLLEFLDSLGAGGVRVNYDPANLVMVVADDPVKGVHTLGKYIVHTHAKDGLQLSANPLKWEEVPLGKGGVKWDDYLRALNEIGFNGFLTIEREVGDTPEADIRMAADFLRERLAALGLN